MKIGEKKIMDGKSWVYVGAGCWVLEGAQIREGLLDVWPAPPRK